MLKGKERGNFSSDQLDAVQGPRYCIRASMRHCLFRPLRSRCSCRQKMSVVNPSTTAADSWDFIPVSVVLVHVDRA